MMDILRMPKNDGTVKKRYYEAYYMSVVRSAQQAGIEVIFANNHDVFCGGSKNFFVATLNSLPFIMDFSDLKPFQVDPKDYKCPYFKWHYSYDYPEHTNHSNVFPLCIIQDCDWSAFENARRKVFYTASGELITNNQRPRAAARHRRTKVQNLLKKHYKEKVSTEFIEQITWWESHNDCLLAVHVPGARNDMLDRGQWELMGLGVCVLSPVIVTVLAGHVSLEPFKHFVPVEDDYSNLIEMIEWCRSHRSTIADIGHNAKLFFESIGPPAAYWKYIKEQVDV